MAKRRNSLDVIGAVNVIEGVGELTIREEKKIVNKNKLNEHKNVIEELNNMEVVEMNEVVILAENMGDTVADVEELREAMVEEMNNVVEVVNANEVVEVIEVVEEKVYLFLNKNVKEFKSEETLALDDEMNEQWLKMFKLRDKLDIGLRNAIKHGYTHTLLKYKAQCITGKELKTLNSMYKTATGGFEITNDQMYFLKRCTQTQYYYMFITLQHAVTKVNTAKREKRFAQYNAKKATA